MSPSRRHEAIKTLIARLLETWSLERDVPINGYGSTTFRNAPRETGLEPDECYVVGRPMDECPDLAIEVALTSGGLPKLELYERLGVKEVWFWVDGSLRLYALAEGGYREVTRSGLLPDLDVELLARFVRLDDQHAAVKAYRDALRSSD